MLNIDIPGREPLQVTHLLLDYNGTIACDGIIKEGVLSRLEQLSQSLQIHVLTADTYGSAHEQCAVGYIRLHVIGKTDQEHEKQKYLRSLGSAACVAIGNGRNDALMLSEAALGFAVLQEEGLCVQSMNASDVLYRSIVEALDALIVPKRLTATLRN
jgi:soluble P-type ATPase